MANPVQFPIRAKILLLIAGITLAATASYLLLATRLFREDKTALVYELNRATVKTLAAETEAYLLKVADKLQLLTQGHRDEEWTRAIFSVEPDLVSYGLYRSADESGKWELVASARNASYLKLYGQDPSALDRVRQELPVPFAQVLAKGSWASNATLPGGAPLVTLAVAVRAVEAAAADVNAPGVDLVAVADVRADKLISLLSDRGIARVYVVDAEGRTVADADPGAVTARAPRADVPIVATALSTPAALQVRRFDWQGRAWLGAFARVGFAGLSVVSQVEENEAFLASRRLVEKSLLFGLIVLTVALLLSEWFSRGLTGPLEKLLAATDRLSRWSFDETVHVRTRDEIGRLARAFNAMVADLNSSRRQLEAGRGELEARVRERTVELERQKTQIVEAQEALLRSTRLSSLGELAGAAAHEVLNPLNNVNIRLERIRGQAASAEGADLRLVESIVTAWRKAYAEGGLPALEKELRAPSQDGGKPMAEEDLQNLADIAGDLLARHEERAEDLEFLMRETGRIGRIVNSMRSLSRVGGERRPVDVHAPIEETLNALTEALGKHRISIVRDYGPETRDRYTVVADKDELVQVFSNLIRNASQAIVAAHRRAGTIRITTSLGSGRVEIRVADNGTGISPDHRDRIFEPSFTTKTLEEGTGLGLSISRRLVRAFGGDVTLERSAEGDGTTFLIWFPVAS